MAQWNCLMELGMVGNKFSMSQGVLSASFRKVGHDFKDIKWMLHVGCDCLLLPLTQAIPSFLQQ